MAAKRTAKTISRRNDGQYQRTIGKAINGKGQLRPRRFLLGKDEHAAERAYVLLGQLWEEVVAYHDRLKQRSLATYEMTGGLLRSPDDPAPLTREQIESEPPQWDEETLAMAQAVCRGQTTAYIPRKSWEGEIEYVERICGLREQFSVIDIQPEEGAVFRRGQTQLAANASGLATHASEASRLAEISLPDTGGWTFYQAIEAYAAFSKESMSPATGDHEALVAERLKQATTDLPLNELSYNAIERIKLYWAKRPPSRRYGSGGKPIAVSTVVGTVKVFRRLLRWIHRNSDIPWRQPDEVEHALRLNVKRLKNEAEVAREARGPDSFSVQDLALLYRYATDLQRMLILLGLNFGFAQKECVDLRRDQVIRDQEPKHVRGVRLKSQKTFMAAIWPETLVAIDWMITQRPDSDYVLITPRGKRYSSSRIANRWNDLLKSVQKDQPDFRKLSFKYLRKTAGQMVKACSDGETVAVFHARASTNSDEYADAYTRRDFEKVFKANQEVRERLDSMFDAAPDAFQNKQQKGGGNVSRGTIDQIRRLREDGVSVSEIAKVTAVSRNTVYRHID